MDNKSNVSTKVKVVIESGDSFREKASLAKTPEEQQSYLECAEACERLAPKLLKLLEDNPDKKVNTLFSDINSLPEHQILVAQRLNRSKIFGKGAYHVG